MKQTFNLLAEALALPFSELFFGDDLLVACIGQAQRGNRGRNDWISPLSKQIDQMGTLAARYINLHTTLLNTSSLQSIVNYVYSAEDIFHAASESTGLHGARDIANYYYTVLLKRIAKTFLTSRNSKAAFKYWPGSNEAYSCMADGPYAKEKPSWEKDLLGGEFETHRIEAWHSLLQCIPESHLLSSYAVCVVEGANEKEKREACFQTLLHFGDTVHVADVLLDKVLDQGLVETHLHAGGVPFL